MSVLINDWPHLGAVAGKAALMYGTALLALRIGERRTVAQWTIIDFATAVAMGAIIGRTATSAGQSYVVGAAAVRYVLYETKGSITVVPEEPSGEERPLVQEGIANSVGYP